MTTRIGLRSRGLKQRRVGRPSAHSGAYTGATTATQQRRTDDAGAQDGFIVGMIYALSRWLLLSAPYTPGLAGMVEAQRSEGGRWKFDKCFRYA